MVMKKLVKCWIYNELVDVPEEYIVIEKEESMFADLQRILERKGWIEQKQKEENDEQRIDDSNS